VLDCLETGRRDFDGDVKEGVIAQVAVVNGKHEMVARQKGFMAFEDR
jgi:hypothetical protein